MEDPVDSFEIHRNDVVFSYQHNRNPFIDYPEYVSLIRGTTNFVSISHLSDVEIYPNPASAYINIRLTANETVLFTMYNLSGEL